MFWGRRNPLTHQPQRVEYTLQGLKFHCARLGSRRLCCCGMLHVFLFLGFALDA